MTSVFATRFLPQEEVTIAEPGPLGTPLMNSWRGNCGVFLLTRRELNAANEVQKEESVFSLVAGSSPFATLDVSRSAWEVAEGVKATRPLGLGHWAIAVEALAGMGLG
jgi:hypothetical protein